MKKLVFRGAGVAVITPFTETGINYPELGRIIEDQIAGGTDAIIITGTTGGICNHDGCGAPRGDPLHCRAGKGGVSPLLRARAPMRPPMPLNYRNMRSMWGQTRSSS